MSQCGPRKRRFAIIAITLVAIATLLQACSVAELKEAVTSDKKDRPAAAVRAPGFTRPGDPEILIPLEPITGARQDVPGVTGQFTRIIAGADETVHFLQPVAVGGMRNFLYIVDAGERAVFRYDLARKTIETLGQAGSEFMGEPSGIYVETDLSFYVADPVGKQVLHFDQSGRVIQRFADPANLSRPVDVVVDEVEGKVYVADGTYSHILVFNKTGSALYAIGSRGRGPGKFRTITSIAKGRGSLFVTDRLELPLQEIELTNGAFRYSFGVGQLIWPTAIALDQQRRMYVSDRSDNTIKIFDDVRLIATVGGSGSAPGRFRLIADMWMSDDGILYVADSLNRRIQVLQVVSDKEPPKLEIFQ